MIRGVIPWVRKGLLFRFGHTRVLALVVLLALLASFMPSGVSQADICGKRYVAGGDDVPAGNTISSSETYPAHLIADHMAKYGYCVYNTAQNSTTSSSYISGGQLATAWNRQPDFITLSVGEQNTPIVDQIKSCFDDIKKHDFSSAISCAQNIQSNSSAYTDLYNNLITIQQQYKMIMSGRPKLVVAIVGYPNPYPQSSDVTSRFTELCQGTTDTIQSCMTRWSELPSALDALDSDVQQLNTTIANAVKPFNTNYQQRFIFVNPYDKFKSHEMKMDVTLKLDEVCHLCGTDATYTDSHQEEKNIGSDNNWFQSDGNDGTDTPFYLQPPDQINDPPVVLVQESQTTTGMGVYPNDTGNKCISDMIWEAVKWKLGIPEALNSNICQ